MTAMRQAQHPAIRVSDCEQRYGCRYTVDTIRRIKRDHPRDRFVWIMGADNLTDFVRWRHWEDIFQALPIAIFDRRSYAQSVSSSKPLLRYWSQKLPDRTSRVLASRRPPAWIFFHGHLHPASASAIRADVSRNASKEETVDNTAQ